MADRQFTWQAIIDTSKATQEAERLRTFLRSSFSGIKIELFDQNAISQSTQAAKAAATQTIEAEKRVTIEAKTGSAERIAAARTESEIVMQAARAAAAARIEEEKRSTAVLKAEIAERQRAIQQQNAASQGGGFNVGNAVIGGIAGYLTVQGARQIFDYAKQVAELSTQVNRTEKAFQVMAGSAQVAEQRIRAIQSASGGTVSSMQAMQIANQATSLGLAKTSAEFTNLTRAARAVTFVSPVIHDVQSAISELGLASANLSWRRLDQLGLSVNEVKERMVQLKAANSGLEDSQAFLQASVDALNAKFGPLLDSTEAQASGVERLSAAWSSFVQNVAASPLGDAINEAFADFVPVLDRVEKLLTGDYGAGASQDKLKAKLRELQEEKLGKDREGVLNVESAIRSASGKNSVETDIELLGRLLALQGQYDQLVKNGVVGIDQYGAKLNEIVDYAQVWGTATDAMASKMLVLEGTLNNVSGALDADTLAGQAYAKAVETLGASFVSGDDRAQGLVAALVNLEIQKQQGLLTAGQYAASINAIAQTFAMLRGEALTAAAAVAGLNAQLGAAVSGGGIGAAVSLGKITSSIQATTATQRLIGSSRGTGEDARIRNVGQAKLDQAAAEKEARAAAAAAKKAATAGTKAFNQAASEMQSLLNSVIKVSQVTQDDIDDAKLGIYKEKPDEYLRQLRDEVLNGKDYKDVSIEDAAEGLNKIGVDTVGKSKEAILKLFEDAFGNLSLFADPENLKFLNDADVQEQIGLQEKIKQGQQNIYEHFGAVATEAVQAAITGSVSGGTAVEGKLSGVTPTINVDGASLAGKSVDITATVTDVAFGTVSLPPDKIKAISDQLASQVYFAPNISTPSAEAIQKFRDDFVTALQSSPKVALNLSEIGIPPEGKQKAGGDFLTLKPKIEVTSQSFTFTNDDAAKASTNISSKIILTPSISTPSAEAIQKFRDDFVTALQSSPKVALNLSEIGIPPEGKQKAGGDFLTLKPKIEVTSQSFTFTNDDAAKASTNISSKIILTPSISTPSAEAIQKFRDDFTAALTSGPKVALNLSEIGIPPEGEGKAGPDFLNLKPRVTLSAGAFTFSNEDAQTVNADIEGKIAPTIDMGVPGRIFMTADSAQATRDALGAAITPTVTPTLQTPNLVAIEKVRADIQATLNAPANATRQLGKAGIQPGAQQGGLIQSYIDGIANSLSVPENSLRLVGIGARIREIIDSGVTLNQDSNVGSDLIGAILNSVLAEQNISVIQGIGFSIYQIILAGIRNAIKSPSNTIGQEIVNGIATQVAEAAAEATKDTP